MINSRKILMMLSCLVILNTNLSYGTNIFSKIKSEIKLKKETKKRKFVNIQPGEYEFTIYELEYPKTIFEKNKFYQSLSKIQNKNKYVFLIDEQFYKDMENLKGGKLTSDEYLLELPASSLRDEEKKEIARLSSGIFLNEYKGTDQEYLNRQVYILYKLLNRSDYKSDYVYSELYKEMLITQLSEERQAIINNFTNSNFDFLIKIDYENISNDQKNYSENSIFDKTIILSNDMQESFVLGDVTQNLYIENFPENLIEKFKNNEIKIKSKLLLLENKQFHGYTYNIDNIVFFINGKNEFYYDHAYKIDINVKKININDFDIINSNDFILNLITVD